jgi:hypothetical protein
MKNWHILKAKKKEKENQKSPYLDNEFLKVVTTKQDSLKRNELSCVICSQIWLIPSSGWLPVSWIYLTKLRRRKTLIHRNTIKKSSQKLNSIVIKFTVAITPGEHSSKCGTKMCIIVSLLLQGRASKQQLFCKCEPYRSYTNAITNKPSKLLLYRY